MHGGAVAEEGNQPFAGAAEVRVAEKDATAARAAALVRDGRSVLLDIGTTAYHLARQLRDTVVLLADSAKFPGTGTAKVCGPEELDVVVTNAPVNPATRSFPEEAGVEVVLAGKAGTT